MIDLGDSNVLGFPSHSRNPPLKWVNKLYGRPMLILEIRPTQLLNTTGMKGGIHDRQVLKYQSSVTSRLIFQYLTNINGIKWHNITLNVTDG